jgi:hypothetical protein
MLNILLEVDKEYFIEYINASGWLSERKIKVKSIDDKYDQSL